MPTNDAPTFVLRGDDALAPEFVRRWARTVAHHRVAPEAVAEAYAVADAMEEWQRENGIAYIAGVKPPEPEPAVPLSGPDPEAPQ